MIKYILLKEIQLYLLNKSMLLTWLLIIVLFLLNAIISVSYYRDLQNKHLEVVIKNNQKLEFDATGSGSHKEMMSLFTGQPYEKINTLADITGLSQEISKPPSILVFMSATSAGLVPDGALMNYFEEPEFASFSKHNPYINSNLSIDWTTVLIYIISFLCICFSYNAFSGEREDGTLQLMFSNSVSRSSIIAAKYLSLLTVFIIPLLLGIIICCIIFEISQTFNMGLIEYAKIAYFFCFSVLIISITILMGLLISALTQKSYISLILSLVCWALAVIVIPNVSWIIGQQVDKVPPEARIQQEIRQQISALEDCYMGWQGNNTPEELVLARKDCMERQINVHNSLWSAYHNMQFEQTHKSIGISKISPFGLFRFFGDQISGNNFYEYMFFFEQIKNYQLTYQNYIVSKDQADPDSRHLISSDSFMAQFMSQQNINPAEVPKFPEQSISFEQIIANSLFDLSILCFWMIGLFVLSFITFIKYDVRQ